ncbi:sarcosine oxidase subunit gamma [uncultured Tateyamaria sp.]|uniref:sarcosine oxidase subunit gamma n=1 Tax=uncultured Tateyamaria sp. TaxID=455651 RepID=UPI0026371680|nr:sarcosine oxidase subunit gamma [uncultured Tateyamaria sp.]
MHDLTPITALGGSAARVDSVGDVTLTEVPDVALASVAARRGHEGVCAQTLESVLGTAAPSPGHAAEGAEYAAFWTGPDQWMLSADFNGYEDIAARIKSEVGDTASVTEQTDAWVCFDLVGPHINAVLELLCNVDLAGFQTGRATRTSIHHLGCYVISTDAGQSVRILGPRASAGSLHHAIITVMASAL